MSCAHHRRSTGALVATLIIVVLGAAAPAHAGPACPADLDGSGDVGFADLLQVLSAWGPCPGCAQDLDGSGDVGFSDLLTVLSAWGPCPGTILGNQQLAGHGLSQYPFFEFVRAFHEGDAVLVAIDPANVGADTSADVYIVAARSAAEWSADRSLTDVRGAPQTGMSFAGATIQANTIVLTSSTTLSSDAGTGFGVGYDIVCDFNENGELDAGDLIDGLSDEAGMYVVKDPTTAGPLAVSQITYTVTPGSVTGGFEGQTTYYPTDIASMGELPLVTISHGNGHQYTWYDYLGNHLASYGYIVMSHRNNTGPGIESASTTTYQHTDAFIGQLASIGGGVLVGHVDTNRITWIGHSRGGEGVARAYTRVLEGSVIPANYIPQDIVLVSSIAPNNSLGPGTTEPAQVNYHLLWGSADGDISGASTGTWSFSIYERAEGFRQSTYVHGADHNDFNCCGFNDFSGPAGTEIGRPEAQQVAKAVYLTLIKKYIDENVPATDFLWRQYENLKPDGVQASTVVVSEYREANGSESFVIDDYQSAPDTGTSSSGGLVSGDVQNLVEGVLRDVQGGYGWTGTDPMNGMSRANAGMTNAGAVFDWSPGTDRTLEFEVVPAARDFTDDTYLAFRACQGTQHPETTAELGDLTFTVTLRDGGGNTSSINIGAYGGGIEEVYQRSGGWQNEFEVIRIRLTDFTHNGTALDLTDIEAVRFDFGDAFGSSRGRLGIDDLVLSVDAAPPTPGALDLRLASDLPTLIAPGEPTTITARITASSEDLVEGSALLYYRFDGGGFQTTPFEPSGGSFYEATLPGPDCGDTPELYLSAQGTVSGTLTVPEDAPASLFSADVGFVVSEFADDFESDTGWTAENLGATSGDWQRGVPVDDPGWDHDPESDSDGSGQCYLTQNETGNTDVDDGAVRLTSPVFDLTTPGLMIGYDYYLKLTIEDGVDRLLVEANNNDGVGAWSTVAVHETNGGLSWRSHEITQDELTAAGVPPTATMRLRFTANDGDEQSIVEAGVDAFMTFTIECE